MFTIPPINYGLSSKALNKRRLVAKSVASAATHRQHEPADNDRRKKRRRHEKKKSSLELRASTERRHLGGSVDLNA